MSTITNTIPGNFYVSRDQQSIGSLVRPKASVELDEFKPSQPLPGSSVSINSLWRLIDEQIKELANAVSGTGKENSAAKKALIDLQKEAQISQLKDREKQLDEQKKAQAKQSFWSKLTTALTLAVGIIAAIVIAPFNPVMAAVMVGVMVAAIVVPKIVDKILESAGVSENIRAKIKIGLEIAIGLVGMLITLNPTQMLKNAAKMAADTAIKVASMAQRSLAALRSMLTNLNPAKLIGLLGKAGLKSATNASKLLDTAITAVKAFKTAILNAAKQTISKAVEIASKAIDEALDAVNQLKQLLSKSLHGLADTVKTASSSLKDQLTHVGSLFNKLSSYLDDVILKLKSLSTTNLLDKVSGALDKVSDMLNTIKSMKPSQVFSKAKDAFDDVLKSMKDLVKNPDKAELLSARVNQVGSAGTALTTSVSTGYGIKSADIRKDMEISKANHDALAVKVEQILALLAQSMRSIAKVMESLFKHNADYRDFNKNMLSVNM
ncbi:hypothetical protein [Vibrio cholerae]|uniref:hypothetical protein n=1 Tax=Vibrio cholerae TaxID=666 RepID=UPI000E6BAAE2|nr:hypothetical protein [Vibrio cholerae]NOE11445.1 hypothetical protein [Vibrio cholerae]NOF33109.1 hypothetical protein [Vibrio cholerae]RJK82851.1 hypothetical protein CHN45_17215 [Vibrio cholerae]